MGELIGAIQGKMRGRGKKKRLAGGEGIPHKGSNLCKDPEVRNNLGHIILRNNLRSVISGMRVEKLKIRRVKRLKLCGIWVAPLIEQLPSTGVMIL